MDNEYKSRQIAALMGGTPEDYQRWKNNARRKPVEKTIVQEEILSKEEKELIYNYRKNPKKMEEIKKEKDFIADTMDKNGRDFYVIESDKKRSVINLNLILCIFPVKYCDGRRMYKVCLEDSENVEVEVDYAEALELVKLTKERLAWYGPEDRYLFGIKISNIAQIYKVCDEYHIEMSRLKYRFHRADNFKTFLRVGESVGEFIIETLQNNGK